MWLNLGACSCEEVEKVNSNCESCVSEGDDVGRVLRRTGLPFPWMGREGFRAARVPWAPSVLERLRRGRAAELRVAVVTDVGVLCTPAASLGSYRPNGGLSSPAVLHLHPGNCRCPASTVWEGLCWAVSCDGCVSYLALLAMSLWCLPVDTWKQNLLLLPHTTLPVILNQSH